MAQGMQTLQQSMTVLTQSTQSKRYVEKPQPYKGKDATDARRFLAAFHHYGATAGNLLNYPDGKGGWNLDHSKWVACAMSLLQDEAAVWAMTEMEKIQVGFWGAASRLSDGCRSPRTGPCTYPLRSDLQVKDDLESWERSSFIDLIKKSPTRDPISMSRLSLGMA